MTIAVSPATQKRIEVRITIFGTTSADDVVRTALDALDDMESADPDDETWAAIDRAEGQYRGGEGADLDEAFGELRRKHFGT